MPKDDNELAHRDSDMTCVACHSSWVTSCFGCHLSMQANRKMPNRHNEGGDSRNFTQYNFQVLRDDIFMLGRDGTVTGNRVAPVRSSSAVLVSSQNQNREWIYSQQQTTSAEGFAGQAFNTHVPHTVRATRNKGLLRLSRLVEERQQRLAGPAAVAGNELRQLHGPLCLRGCGPCAGSGGGNRTERAAGSVRQHASRIAYPDNYEKFVKGGSELKTVYEHVGNPRVLQVQLRGEYAYVAAGEGGLRVYDVAQIDQKGFSERIVTAPVSRFGQKFWVKTKYATAVAAPTTLAVDPARWRVKS